MHGDPPQTRGPPGFVVLERGTTIGGTWRDNTDPGCACDIPAILYAFSFAPKSDWSRTYPTQPEILPISRIAPSASASPNTSSSFQRTAPWVLPKRDVAVGGFERALRRFVPGYAWTLRAATYWQHEVRALGFAVEPALLARMEKPARRDLERRVPEPALRAKVAPADRMGCRRVLLSNDDYPALRRSNVAVVTEPIVRLERDAVVTDDGLRHPADAIAYATGFRAQDGGTANVFGAGGRSLAETWRGGMHAYLGTSVAGFPNLFFLVGPNSGLGHNSMIDMIESHVSYVMSALRFLRGRRGAALDVRPGVEPTFNDALERRMRHTVWTSGCRSWYLDRNGKNTTLRPGFSFEFRRRTARLDPRRYRVSASGAAVASENPPAPSKRTA